MNFEEFHEYSSNNLEASSVGGSKTCRSVVTKAFSALGKMFEDDVESVYEMFNICESSDLSFSRNQQVSQLINLAVNVVLDTCRFIDGRFPVAVKRSFLYATLLQLSQTL